MKMIGKSTLLKGHNKNQYDSKYFSSFTINKSKSTFYKAPPIKYFFSKFGFQNSFLIFQLFLIIHFLQDPQLNG